MQQFFDTVGAIDGEGDVIVLAGASVTVYDAGTANVASIYSDDGVTVKDNPFLSGEEGQISFYASDGRYDIYVYLSPYKPVKILDILLEDPTTSSSGEMSTHLSTFTHSDISVNKSSVTSLGVVDSQNKSLSDSADVSLATRDSQNTSIITSASLSLTTKDSQNLSVAMSADLSAVTRLSNVDSALSSASDSNIVRFSSSDSALSSSDNSIVTELSTADSTVLSTAISAADSASSIGGEDSVAQSMATSVATQDSIATSQANSADLSIASRLSSADSTVVSTASSNTDSADTSVVTSLSSADSTVLSTALSAADSAVIAGGDSAAQSMATSVATQESTTTSQALSADVSLISQLSIIDSSDKSIALSAAQSAADLASGGAVDDVARDNIVLNAWRLAILGGLSVFDLEDGVVDEFEDETGVDTDASTNEGYNSSDDYYSPSPGTVVDNMEYASDALAQAAYVTNGATYDSYTKLLAHFDGADESTNDYTAETGQTVSLEGTAKLDSAQKKFGATAIWFDGNSDYATVPDSADWNFDADFTVDFWVYLDDYPAVQTNIIGNEDDAAGSAGWTVVVLANGTLAFRANYSGGYAISLSGSAGNVGIDAWHHVAIVRNGTSIKGYVDGVEKLSATNNPVTNIGDSSYALTIGKTANTASYYTSGWVDEVRVSKGIARWTSAFTPPTRAYPNTDTAGGETYTLESFSESTIKTQGSYSLKGIATTAANGKTLTRTIGSPIDLSGVNSVFFDIYASRTGSNIKVGIHDSGGTTTEITPNITDSNTWQEVEIDLSGVADANKDAIDSVIITIVNADSANTFYIDAFVSDLGNMTLISEPSEAEAEPTNARLIILAEPVDSITINTDLKGYVSLDDGSNFEQVTLVDQGNFDTAKHVYAGSEDLTDRDDKTMVWKIETANNKNIKIHAIGLLWK